MSLISVFNFLVWFVSLFCLFISLFIFLSVILSIFSIDSFNSFIFVSCGRFSNTLFSIVSLYLFMVSIIPILNISSLP